MEILESENMKLSFQSNFASEMAGQNVLQFKSQFASDLTSLSSSDDSFQEYSKISIGDDTGVPAPGNISNKEDFSYLEENHNYHIFNNHFCTLVCSLRKRHLIQITVKLLKTLHRLLGIQMQLFWKE